MTQTQTYNLLVNDPARFGNKFFNCASSMGIAKRNNRQVACGENMLMLKEIFTKLKINLQHEEKIYKPIHLKDFHGLDVDERFFKLPNKNVTMKNLLQNFEYFEDIKSDLFSQLSYINSSIESTVQGFINRVKKQASTKLSSKQLTTVCVHERRSDYVKASLVGKQGRKITLPEQIKFAMKFTEEKYKYVIFIVASERQEMVCKTFRKSKYFYL